MHVLIQHGTTAHAYMKSILGEIGHHSWMISRDAWHGVIHIVSKSSMLRWDGWQSMHNKMGMKYRRCLVCISTQCKTWCTSKQQKESLLFTTHECILVVAKAGKQMDKMKRIQNLGLAAEAKA